MAPRTKTHATIVQDGSSSANLYAISIHDGGDVHSPIAVSLRHGSREIVSASLDRVAKLIELGTRAEAEQIQGSSIGWAVQALKKGHRVTRTGWNGRGMWLELQVPDAHSKMTLPYVYMRTATGERVPWLCSQSDLLANDWEISE